MKDGASPWTRVIWDTIEDTQRGPVARRVVIAFTGVLAVGRLGVLQLTAPDAAAGINKMSAWQYGFVFAVLFVALVITRDKRRMTLTGFLVSAMGAGAYAMLACDVWPVATSAGYYALMGLLLTAEAAVIWKGLHVH